MWGAVLKKRNHFFLKVFANNIENSLFKSHHSVFHLSGKDICGCINYLFETQSCVLNVCAILQERSGLWKKLAQK